MNMPGFLGEKPRIVVTGINGQVGSALMQVLSPYAELIGLNRQDLDLTDSERITKKIRELNPDIILNPAAYTAVDAAEKDQDTAFAVNGSAPATFAEIAKELGIFLVHYSTDYVFDGHKATPYVETDVPAPKSVYGASKLAGEQAVLKAVEEGLNAWVLRTSWVYSRMGKNFLLTIQRLARERPELRVVADQWGAPTWATTIAETTTVLLMKAWRGRGLEPVVAPGLYHLTAQGSTTWHGFAQAIVDHTDLAVRPSVQPITTAEYPLPAPRPANSCLSCQKLEAALGQSLPDWREALRVCFQ